MHAELLAQTHLIMLPLLALFLFLAVYFTVIVRAMLSPCAEVSTAAQIPLEDDGHV